MRFESKDKFKSILIKSKTILKNMNVFFYELILPLTVSLILQDVKIIYIYIYICSLI